MVKIEFLNVTKIRSIDGEMHKVLDDVSVAVQKGPYLQSEALQVQVNLPCWVSQQA